MYVKSCYSSTEFAPLDQLAVHPLLLVNLCKFQKQLRELAACESLSILVPVPLDRNHRHVVIGLQLGQHFIAVAVLPPKWKLIIVAVSERQFIDQFLEV
jgi:hypothetical protein